MAGVIQPRAVDDKQGREDHPAMAEGDITLTIDAALAERLKTVSKGLGKSPNDYARQLLDAYIGLDPLKEDQEESQAYWDNIQRICDETERDGGIRLEDMERWMRSWGTQAELPPPEPRPRIPE
jgi:hypothetical protein